MLIDLSLPASECAQMRPNVDLLRLGPVSRAFVQVDPVVHHERDDDSCMIECDHAIHTAEHRRTAQRASGVRHRGHRVVVALALRQS